MLVEAVELRKPTVVVVVPYRLTLGVEVALHRLKEAVEVQP
jgi:hypothetical protein